MGTLSFLYPAGIKNVPRNYMRGIALPPVVEGVTFIDNVLEFHQFLATNHWVIPFKPNAVSATSNVYSTDYFFNLDDCMFYHAGLPALNQLNVYISYAPGEVELRLCIATEFGFEPANYVDWFFPIGPWPPHDI